MYNINPKPPVYDEALVHPMRDELKYVGFKEVLTPQMIDEELSLKKNDSVLVVINSVCGCAAGSARPGIALALQGSVIPDRLITVFAGQEREAIEYLREKYLKPFPPSSPCMALFKNGELKYFMPRHEIEGMTPEEIGVELGRVFAEHCTKQGPSISPDDYTKLIYAKSCGSNISLN